MAKLFGPVPKPKNVNFFNGERKGTVVTRIDSTWREIEGFSLDLSTKFPFSSFPASLHSPFIPTHFLVLKKVVII